MNLSLSTLLNWRLHAIVLIISGIAELIGTIQIDIGIGILILLPLLYAFVISVFFNPNIFPPLGQLVGQKGSTISSQWIIIALMPFMAKFAVGIGPQIEDIIAAGPALVLQEFGNIFTVLLALPVAVMLFGMGREAIGATHSIAREPNIALVADRYGLKTPEGIGVMGVYVMGTIFGGVFFSLLSGLVAGWGIFDVRALAMACGVGSGSMMGACTAAMTQLMPEQADQITAFAASSNLLTYATGLFFCVFISLPVAERLYKLCAKARVGSRSGKTAGAPVIEFDDTEETKVSNLTLVGALVAMSVFALLVNWVSTGVNPIEAAPGMAVIYVLCLIGIGISHVVRIGVPNVAWISIAAIFAALPFMPFDAWVIEQTDKISMMAMITPALAYSGIAISKAEVTVFKRSGVKLAIVALLTFTGTYLGSAVIADLLV